MIESFKKIVSPVFFSIKIFTLGPWLRTVFRRSRWNHARLIRKKKVPDFSNIVWDADRVVVNDNYNGNEEIKM